MKIIGSCKLHKCYGDAYAVDTEGSVSVCCDRCSWHQYVYPNEGIDVTKTAIELAKKHICKPTVLSRFDLDRSCEKI